MIVYGVFVFYFFEELWEIFVDSIFYREYFRGVRGEKESKVDRELFVVFFLVE